jgi:hypothetical protein
MAGAGAEGGAGVGTAVRNYNHNTMCEFNVVAGGSMFGRNNKCACEKEGVKMDRTVLATGARHSRPGKSQMETGS